MTSLISIVVPVFNEEDNLPELAQRVFAVADELRNDDADVELVLVDDCSSDRTEALARQLVEGERRVKYLRFARNAGSHAALSAGLESCSGDCAVLMAADLQDPPELIPQFIANWKNGHDVVWAVRGEREGESLSTQWFARFFYWVMRKTALPNMPATGADFVLVDRRVIDVYGKIGEKNANIMALLLWMGFRQTSFEYVKEARTGGESGWTLSKKIKLFIDSLVSFSYVPIRLMSALGLIMAACGFVYAGAVVTGRIVGWVAAGADGFAALMTVLLIGQGTILTMLGVLGEYLWRSFDETRGRPRYIVQEFMQSSACDRSGQQNQQRPSLMEAAAYRPPEVSEANLEERT